MGSFGEPFRVMIVRHDYLAPEWNRGVEAHQQLRIASAVKSVHSCLVVVSVPIQASVSWV